MLGTTASCVLRKMTQRGNGCSEGQMWNRWVRKGMPRIDKTIASFRFSLWIFVFVPVMRRRWLALLSSISMKEGRRSHRWCKMEKRLSTKTIKSVFSLFSVMWWFITFLTPVWWHTNDPFSHFNHTHTHRIQKNQLLTAGCRDQK